MFFLKKSFSLLILLCAVTIVVLKNDHQGRNEDMSEQEKAEQYQKNDAGNRKRTA